MVVCESPLFLRMILFIFVKRLLRRCLRGRVLKVSVFWVTRMQLRIVMRRLFMRFCLVWFMLLIGLAMLLRLITLLIILLK